MLASDLATRIEGAVDDLAGRVKQAADLSELTRQKAWPQASPYAFVLPLGLRPRDDGQAGAGYFHQMLDEIFAVVLFVRASGDITGGKTLPKIDELAGDTIGAVCGWGPDEAIGVFRLSRGQLLKADSGVVLFQLDFAIQTQTRITS